MPEWLINTTLVIFLIGLILAFAAGMSRGGPHD